MRPETRLLLTSSSSAFLLSSASPASPLSTPLLAMCTAPITLDPSSGDPCPAIASSPPPAPPTLDCQTPSLSGLSNELKLRIVDELDERSASLWGEGPLIRPGERNRLKEIHHTVVRDLFRLATVNKTFADLSTTAFLREAYLTTWDPHDSSVLPSLSRHFRVLVIGDWFDLLNDAPEPEKDRARRLAWDELAAEVVSNSINLRSLRIVFHGMLSRRQEEQRNEAVPGLVFFRNTLDALMAGPAAQLQELSLVLRIVDWSDNGWTVQLLQTCKKLRRLELLTEGGRLAADQPTPAAAEELPSVIQGMTTLKGLRFSRPPGFFSDFFLPPALTSLSLLGFELTQAEFSDILHPIHFTLKTLFIDKPPRPSSPQDVVASYRLTALSSLFVEDCRFADALSPLLRGSTSLSHLKIGECTWHSFIPSGHSPSLPSLLKSSAPPSLRNLTIGKFAGTSALHWTLRREIFKLREWCTSRRVEAKLPELAEEMWIGLGARESGGLLRGGGGGGSAWESRRARRWRWTGGDERYGDERPGGISLLSIE